MNYEDVMREFAASQPPTDIDGKLIGKFLAGIYEGAKSESDEPAIITMVACNALFFGNRP